jgi:phosphoribosylformimino-5-aminoimidazole carboxamide ribotide isomerase
MSQITLYPALDLRGGNVVRLRQGDPAQQTVYGDDPVSVAQHWIDFGAKWLHVVNLDGAFGAENANEAIVQRLAALGTPIQFGGGLRTSDDVRRAFDLGVRRVVLGTLVVENPDTLKELLATYGADAIAVALDAKDGRIVTRGWQQSVDITPIQLGKKLAALGARHALYTDVNRDGELVGVNVASTIALARETGLQVIASGGVMSLSDIRVLAESRVVAGAVLGKALYEGMIDLREAVNLVS